MRAAFFPTAIAVASLAASSARTARATTYGNRVYRPSHRPSRPGDAHLGVCSQLVSAWRRAQTAEAPLVVWVMPADVHGRARRLELLAGIVEDASDSAIAPLALAEHTLARAADLDCLDERVVVTPEPFAYVVRHADPRLAVPLQVRFQARGAFDGLVRSAVRVGPLQAAARLSEIARRRLHLAIVEGTSGASP